MGDTSQESAVKEEENPVNAPVSRETRRSYVFFVTFFCLVSLILMPVFGAVGLVAEIIAAGFVDIIKLLIVFYIGASVLDRGDFLQGIVGAVGAKRTK